MVYVEIVNRISSKKGTKRKASLKTSYLPPLVTAQLAISSFQRGLLIGFHKDGSFSQATIRLLEQELDYEELRLDRLTKSKGAAK